MSEKRWYEPLIENTPLAVIVVGVFLFIVGAAGGFPTLRLEVKELGWRIALAVMGAIVAISGGLFIWFGKFKTNGLTDRSFDPAIPESKPTSALPQGDPRREIEGKFQAEDDPNYINRISHISDSIFTITNPVWDGVGVFDGETYFGVYKYNNKAKPEMRTMWGTHKADLRFERKRWLLEVSGTEMNMNNPSVVTPWDRNSKWFKADD
jgi:hypothetical protein